MPAEAGIQRRAQVLKTLDSAPGLLPAGASSNSRGNDGLFSEFARLLFSLPFSAA
jgi:hypothetical protein